MGERMRRSYRGVKSRLSEVDCPLSSSQLFCSLLCFLLFFL